ncbi:MAG: helix-turn-helix domain-containing protein [Planctomycetota bacterium]
MRTRPESAPSPASSWGVANHDEDTAGLLSAPVAARRLGIGTRSLGKLTAADAIPSHKVLRRRLYDPAELQAWLDMGAPAEPGSAAAVREAMRGGAV